MNRPEWVFVERDNGTILVHNCDKNHYQYTKDGNGIDYVWDSILHDKWQNPKFHCYDCNKEPPQELITQMLLLNCHGINYDKQNDD